LLFGGVLWLVIYDGIIAVLAEDSRRDLPASVAVDAGSVYEEITGDVLRQALSYLGHSLHFIPVASSAAIRVTKASRVFSIGFPVLHARAIPLLWGFLYGFVRIQGE
jgi:hypothetical protein